MKNIVKEVVIQTVITLIITSLANLALIYILKNDAKIELISSRLENNKYQSIIAIKNLRQSEYLKNIEIIIDENVTINNINTGSGEYKNETIKFGNIQPYEVKTIIIISDEKICEKDIKLIKNGQRVELENFNNYTDYKFIYVLLILAYAIINAIMGFLTLKKQKLENDKIKTVLEKTEKNCEEVENRIFELNKASDTQKLIYIKEMNEMERELKFYQELIYKICDKKVSKEEMEKQIIKELKIFKKKKFQHLSYNDAYNIIMQLSKNQKESND